MGLAPIDKTNPTKTAGNGIFRAIFSSIPPICSIVATLITYRYSFVEDSNYHRILIIVSDAYFLMCATSNIVANVQCLVYKNEYFDIIHRINHINGLFIVHCDREVNYQKFFKSYRNKFFTVCSFWLSMGMGSYIIHFESFTEFVYTTTTLALDIISVMSCVHTILLVDHVGLFVKEMNEAILSPQFQSTTHLDEMKQNFVKIKIIHLEMYNLVQQINKFFGWSFVTLCTKYLIDITYTFYFTYFNFDELGWKTVYHLGMFSIQLD